MNYLPIQHCVKSVCIRSYSGPCFHAFGLNTEGYSESLRISPNVGKYRPEQLRIQTLFAECNLKRTMCLIILAQLSGVYLFELKLFRNRRL